MAYTQAMEKSVKKRFPGDNGGVEVINCMCHSLENLYRYDSTAMARASDDFYPERSETWTTHLVNVAYNSKSLRLCIRQFDPFVQYTFAHLF